MGERKNCCEACRNRHKVNGTQLGLIDGKLSTCYEAFILPDFSTPDFQHDVTDGLRMIGMGLGCPQGWEDESLIEAGELVPQAWLDFFKQNPDFDTSHINKTSTLMERVSALLKRER